MHRRPEDLYLDLMKRTLAFTLWPEPPRPLDAFNDTRPFFKRIAVSGMSRILRSKNLQLVKLIDIPADDKQEGKGWPAAYADTMIGLKRLDNLQFCVETVIREGVEGDLIETGVWRGGACILMRAILAAYAIENRKVYVADSFEGLPAPDPERFPADEGARFHLHQFFAVSQQEVEDNFRKYDLLDDRVVFLKGWFKDTLPNAPIEKLAVLRLDGDMYESTMDALTSLYPRVSKGGFCIIDDYALPGCRSAVNDFRTQNGITSEMKLVDWTGSYWRKL
jgi:O-methyltransferase